VKPVVPFDSGPLGALAHPRALPLPTACRQWLASLVAVNRRVIVSEIAHRFFP
jgi:hypothetical protein